MYLFIAHNYLSNSAWQGLIMRAKGGYYEKKGYTMMVNNFTYINKTNDHFSPQLIVYKNDHDI
jgi:hypothetical protein